jgi:hypothetical protein
MMSDMELNQTISNIIRRITAIEKQRAKPVPKPPQESGQDEPKAFSCYGCVGCEKSTGGHYQPYCYQSLYTPEQWAVFKAARVFTAKYVAMDKDGEIFLYYELPHKGERMWLTDGGSIELSEEMRYIFTPFISWNDTEPFEIPIPTGGE